MEHYILIGLYTFLFILAIVNIWNILIKQKRYKTLPLLGFYIFATLSIVFRIIYVILVWSSHLLVVMYANDLFLYTKLSVGLLQSWMIFEIAMRVR